MADDLAELLRTEVGARFAHMKPQFGTEPNNVVRISCPSGAMGDVRIYAEGELLVYIEETTHLHFDLGDEREMVDRCCRFLADLFDDKVVVWRAPGQDGSFYPEMIEGRGSAPADARMATWSGPWPVT